MKKFIDFKLLIILKTFLLMKFRYSSNNLISNRIDYYKYNLFYFNESIYRVYYT